MLVNLLIATLLALCLLAGWALLSRIKPSRSRRMLDGWARVEGSCGRSMEIGLAVAGGRVQRSVARTDGCGCDRACLDAAARLARGKALPEIFAIDAPAILRAAGDIPDDHRHCADTAARALHAASRRAMERRGADVPGQSAPGNGGRA